MIGARVAVAAARRIVIARPHRGTASPAVGARTAARRIVLHAAIMTACRVAAAGMRDAGMAATRMAATRMAATRMAAVLRQRGPGAERQAERA